MLMAKTANFHGIDVIFDKMSSTIKKRQIKAHD